MANAHAQQERTRASLRIRGVVQGVGFRPAVYRVATAMGLAGLVRNDADGVWIEIEGADAAVSGFQARLYSQLPPLARIDSCEVRGCEPLGEVTFRVVESTERSAGSARIPPDTATCDACLSELFDPSNRRYRYPFINCTDCGPRYTIVRDVPYDRARTTMSAFPLCGQCRAEYEDPGSRRFHAEPNACAACGPRLSFVRGEQKLSGEAALAEAIAAIASGAIVAVKGLGGFFLAVDARNEAAVARLRERKHRPDKPFALMVRDLSEAARIVELDPVAQEALCSPARPIVLAPARAGIGVVASVAPRLGELGVMLPYTPLHHLLLCGEVPWMVMTSGNLSEEPIACDNGRALERLGTVADVFLLHDRDIHARADDGVVRIVAGRAQPVRRARGSVPAGLALPFLGAPILAVGAELKNTVCLTRGQEAILSPHLGDLSNPETFEVFTEAIDSLSELLGVTPAYVAHDLHPDYRSTRWALESGLPRIPIQHHHAHVAACLAEHGRSSPTIGIAFDGTGCGPAGELWGGEILIADLRGFQRWAHLWPLPLPGGEAAIREPWRLACAALLEAGVSPVGRIDAPTVQLEQVERMWRKGIGCPRASGAGRWFDAIAALCGVRGRISYEGQAAIELEALADKASVPPYPFSWERRTAPEPATADLRPVVRAVMDELSRGEPVGRISARFHETLAQVVAAACRELRDQRGLSTVALSGGCFQNRLLTERTAALLGTDGFEVLLHRQVPPNDGGVSFGQAAIAAQWLEDRRADHVSGHSR